MVLKGQLLVYNNKEAEKLKIAAEPRPRNCPPAYWCSIVECIHF